MRILFFLAAIISSQAMANERIEVLISDDANINSHVRLVNAEIEGELGSVNSDGILVGGWKLEFAGSESDPIALFTGRPSFFAVEDGGNNRYKLVKGYGKEFRFSTPVVLGGASSTPKHYINSVQVGVLGNGCLIIDARDSHLSLVPGTSGFDNAVTFPSWSGTETTEIVRVRKTCKDNDRLRGRWISFNENGIQVEFGVNDFKMKLRDAAGDLQCELYTNPYAQFASKYDIEDGKISDGAIEISTPENNGPVMSLKMWDFTSTPPNESRIPAYAATIADGQVKVNTVGNHCFCMNLESNGSEDCASCSCD